ncbi:MAG: tetratricopeptide repeat protein [Myxococcota bacterium]
MRFVLPCLLVACASAGGLPPAAIDHNQQGVTQLADGSLDDAEARFRLALEYHPRFAEPHANLGLVMLRRGDLTRAEDHLRTAIQLDANFDEAWSNLGVVLSRQGRDDEAAEAFTRALSIDPGLADARRNLADLWIRQERFAEARAQLMRLVQITDNGRAEGQLAYCELRIGRPAEARRRAEAVLTRMPSDPYARLVRGIIHVTHGNHASALDDLLRAERSDVVTFEARLRVAAVQIAQGNPSAATARIDWLLRHAPENAAVRLLAGWHALGVGRPDDARTLGEGALYVDPGLSAAEDLIAQACALGANCDS